MGCVTVPGFLEALHLWGQVSAFSQLHTAGLWAHFVAWLPRCWCWSDETQLTGCDIICILCQKPSTFQDKSGNGASCFSSQHLLPPAHFKIIKIYEISKTPLIRHLRNSLRNLQINEIKWWPYSVGVDLPSSSWRVMRASSPHKRSPFLLSWYLQKIF